MATFDYLGAGLILPFQRDGKDDFLHSSGIDMIKSTLKIILETMSAGPDNSGEVPYNQDLGTLAKLLRHSNVNDPTTREIVAYHVIDGIQRNEPRVKIKVLSFTPKPDSKRTICRIKFDVVSRDTKGINVIASDVELETEL